MKYIYLKKLIININARECLLGLSITISP